MNIKLYFFIFSISLVFSGIAQIDNNITINGTLNSVNGNELILLLDYTGNNPPIATAEVSEEGIFELKTAIEAPNIFKLQLSDQNFISLILEDGDIINISADADNLRNNLVIEGSDHTSLLYNIGNNVHYYELKLDSINKEFNESRKSGTDIKALSPLRDEYTEINNEKTDYIASVIKNHSESLASLFFIDKLDISQDFNTFEILDKSLYEKYPENIYVKNLHTKVENERKLAIGALAPDLTLPDPDSNLVSLSSLKGNVVLIDFWAAWCGPCRKENPNIVRLYNQYKGKGFEIFGVSLDKNRNAWLNAIESDGLTWTQVSDLKFWDSDAAKTYQVKSIPYTVLLDRDGRIIAKKLRGEALENKLHELLDE